MKRALVSLPDGLWPIIEELKGKLGNANSEVIRNIVIAYLAERGILMPTYNVESVVGPTSVDRHEAKLNALVQTLIEEKLIDRKELERRINLGFK